MRLKHALLWRSSAQNGTACARAWLQFMRFVVQISVDNPRLISSSQDIKALQMAIWSTTWEYLLLTGKIAIALELVTVCSARYNIVQG